MGNVCHGVILYRSEPCLHLSDLEVTELALEKIQETSERTWTWSRSDLVTVFFPRCSFHIASDETRIVCKFKTIRDLAPHEYPGTVDLEAEDLLEDVAILELAQEISAFLPSHLPMETKRCRTVTLLKT